MRGKSVYIYDNTSLMPEGYKQNYLVNFRYLKEGEGG